MFTKFRRTAGLLLASGLMLAGASTAVADDAGARSEKKQLKQGKSVSGKVTAIKVVKLKDSNQRHLVAQIQTSGGNKKIVDLGPREDANALQLQLGDRVEVRGMTTQIGGRSVMIANHAKTNDGMLSIDRSQQLQLDREVGQAQPLQSQSQPQPVCPPLPDEG
jgi:hypothetical protein